MKDGTSPAFSPPPLGGPPFLTGVAWANHLQPVGEAATTASQQYETLVPKEHHVSAGGGGTPKARGDWWMQTSSGVRVKRRHHILLTLTSQRLNHRRVGSGVTMVSTKRQTLVRKGRRYCIRAKGNR
jgi:hypothetical protein